MECIYCKKTNHTSKRCFFKKLHKQPEQLEKQQKSEIKIWRTTKGKNINKCYNQGKLILKTKHNLETTKLPQGEAKVQEIKTTTSYHEEPELIILDTTEDDIEFVKARCDQKQSASVNTIRTETIEAEISTCNIADHQLLHKKLRILEDKNKRLQIEIHNWKKHYLKTHMELMDNLE